MFNAFVFSVLAVFILGAPSADAIVRESPASLEPCVLSTQMHDYFAKIRKKKCPGLEDVKSFNQIPHVDQRLAKFPRNDNTQKFRVEYIDECPLGLENRNGCDQNPDEGRCSDGSAPFVRVIRFSGGNRDGELLAQNRLCPGDLPQDPVRPEQLVERIAVTPEQFRKFPIKPSDPNSDPQNFSLRNGHAHFWAIANTQTFETEINGTSVEVRAIPIEWRWNYGDGSTRSFDYPGNAAPEHTLHHQTPTSHSYDKTGFFDVNLMTLYRGEFRAAGGPWEPIPGQAAVPSEPMPMDVWRTQKELIAPDGK
ncbi:hypothetical protein GCM10009526_20660 [Glutamicibacter creatinolyticus]